MTTSHERDLERLLEDDGGEFAALYRRLPRAEPPRRLDRSVIAEAARAVRGHPPRRQRWLVGFGSAAGLVLAAGIAWHAGQDALHRQRMEPAAAQRVVPVNPITEPGVHKIERATPPHPTAEMEVARSPAAPPARQAAKPAAPAVPMSAPVPFPAPPQVQSRQEEYSRAAPAPSASAMESAAANDSADQAISEKHAQPAAAKVQQQDNLRRSTQTSPNEELAGIRRLLREGKRSQAVRDLREFQQRHPDVPLPDDLRDLGK